ncbi:phage BR0599 family protein [Sinorhizobium fredii]|uniref:phage BR0599 family protein n=1 Tax=Rhizobium fredii TaxID=380 RepID=UPI0004B1C29B|nr:phage BR0599 family protein [Sinorhizobium fredii]ASY68907.1 Phage FAD/FMN-containing dehydrogenase [Sinorhizobium fredii CCBAU 83666]
MSFSGIETSRQRGAPVTLYLFVYGGAEGDSPPPQAFAYTDAEQDITYEGFTYVPKPITRDNVNSSGTLDKSTLQIRMPRDIELAEEFRVYPPAQVMSLIIRQGHLSDPDSPREFLVCWSGRVLSVGREGDECVIAGEPVSSSLRRPGLRRNYQLGCPHVLYGAQCQASEAAATVTATVASISGTSITLNAGWDGAFDAAKFTEGLVKWTNDTGGIEIRKILSVSGDTLSLGGLLRDLNASDTVSVILGCNHQMGDCRDLHDNIHNFGGCPWIPTKNPIGFRNNYY